MEDDEQPGCCGCFGSSGKKGATTTSETPARAKGITEFAAKKSKGGEGVKVTAAEDLTVVVEGLKRVLVWTNMNDEVMQTVASYMYERKVPKDATVIEEGAEGDDEMFIVRSGHFKVMQDLHGAQVSVNEKKVGDVFGELALMYGAARSATVVATTDSSLWVLERAVFRRYVREVAQAQTSERDVFLNSVPILSPLTGEERMRVSEALHEKDFKPGEMVVKQGEAGELFYIVMKGEAAVTEQTERGEEKVNHLFKGDFFGERALLKDEPRGATVKAVGSEPLMCLTLARKEFSELLGPLQNLMERAKSPVVVKRRMIELQGQNTWASNCGIKLHCKRLSGPGTFAKTAVTVKNASMSLVTFDGYAPGEDVELEEGALLGGGASGIVYHVVDKKSKKEFALKCMRKLVVSATPGHVFCEKAITKMLMHPFCMRQHAAFQDNTTLYFLFDYCDGCDLMDALAGVATIRQLRPPGRPFGPKVRVLQGMKENIARFYIGSIALALEYLHSLNVVYRDLKPENVLLDGNGYPKLGDFGFAKTLDSGGGRTYTFCGTPGYVAPEVVLARGYGTAVDWWGLGVTMFVLLTGQQPFSRTVNGVPDDPLTVMKRIVDPLWNITFPPYVTNEAMDIINRLLERRPAKRLGNLLNRAEELKNHPWYEGFSWDALETKRMPGPSIILAGSYNAARQKRIRELEQDVAKNPHSVDLNRRELDEANKIFADF
mmetsp:Transcript_15859/g.51973  ORF Transcript_15859/g.51973 Transcript_15859/m.51973 type:complete len:718 (-) Transcript_15859:2059-4212(-)